MTQNLERVVDLSRYPVADKRFALRCGERLDRDGALLLPGFVMPLAIGRILDEATCGHRHAYYCRNSHTVYLSPVDPGYPSGHARNRQVTSTKGCITDDQLAGDSPLRMLYDDADFRSFLCMVLREERLYEYADPLSSINLHYYQAGQELGWHFDNSSFAVTLMIQKPEAGGVFEYIPGLRDAESNDMNFSGVERALNGLVTPLELDMQVGALVLFRGRNALHRVTPVKGGTSRIQSVLAYNTHPGIALSEQARMTFYGRLQ